MVRFALIGMVVCLLAGAGCIMTSVGGGSEPAFIAAGAIPPKGKHESPQMFRLRLQAQAKSSVVIPPKGKSESPQDFQLRLEAQQKLTPSAED